MTQKILTENNGKPEKGKTIFDLLRRLAMLYIEDIKLTSAEKLTIMFSGVALLSVLMVLTVLALIFIAMGVTDMLQAYIAPFWSYFIIAGIFIVLICILVIFKKQTIEDPIARFISRLFITPSKNN